MRNKVKGLKKESIRKAMVLVGGIVTSGQLGPTNIERSKLQDKKRDEFKDAMKRIASTPQAFEAREMLIGTYAMTKKTYACGANMEGPRELTNERGSVHNSSKAGKVRWSCQAIVMTMHARGHLVDPWQAEKYTAIRTMRRLIMKREKC